MDRYRKRCISRPYYRKFSIKLSKKKVLETIYGRIEVPTFHVLLKGKRGSKISPFLQEKLIYIGQLECLERASEITSVLMNVTINDTAIYRLTDDSMGKQCEDLIEKETFREKIAIDEEETLYVQSDGSILLTRENR